MADFLAFAVNMNVINLLNAFLPPGAGELIVIFGLLAGLIVGGLMLNIHRATRGLMTNMWTAKRTGKPLAIIPFLDGLLYTEVLTTDKVTDGRFKFKDKYTWFIYPEGIGMWAAGIAYTILVPELCVNMTLNQMASWLRKKALVMQYRLVVEQKDAEGKPVLNPDGSPVLIEIQDPSVEQVRAKIMEASRIPSAASAETRVNQTAAIMFANKAKDEGNKFEKYGPWVILGLGLLLAIVILNSQPQHVVLENAQTAANVVANATSLV